MAAVSVDDPTTPSARRVFVDTPRWDAVVGDFVSGTSVAAATTHMPALATQVHPLMIRSDTLSADVTAIAPGSSSAISVTFLSDAGFLRTAHLRFTGPGTVTAPLGPCAVGCSVESVKLHGSGFELASLSAGQARVLGPTSYAGGAGQVALAPEASAKPALALTTTNVRKPTNLLGIDGTGDPVQVVGTVGAVPFVGRTGALLDLGRVLLGSVGTIASADSVVVARADTPASVLAQLKRGGGGTTTTYAAVADKLDGTPQARADSLAFLVAIGVALIALTHLLAWLAGQLGRRRAEVAGLRAAGIRPRSVRGAYLVEATFLAAIVLVAAAVAAVLTTIPLLKPMELVGGWPQAPILRLEIRPLTLATVVLGVAVVTILLCAVVFTRFGRSARPAALRSADR